MRTLTETIGVLAAAVLLACFAFPWAGRARYVLACVVVAAAVSVPLAFGTMNSQIGALAANHEAVLKLQREQHPSQAAIDNIVGARTGVNTAFTDFARANMPPGSTYYLAVTPGLEAGGVAHWITWRFLPHIPTGIEGQRGDGVVNPPSLKDAQKADYVVFYGLDPKKWRLRDQVKLGRLKRFAPRYFVAKRVG
jgi:hypothetical protein